MKDTGSSKTIKSKLKRMGLEITTCDTGFTVWVKEKVKGIKRKSIHWIIDASTIMNDGEIRFGQNNMYNINAEYDEDLNGIVIVDRSSK